MTAPARSHPEPEAGTDATRRAERERLLRTFGHEAKSPLNVILGYAGTLLMQLPGPLNAAQEQQLLAVQLSARQLLDLLDDVLDVVRLEVGEAPCSLQPLELTRAIRQAVSSTGGLFAERGLTVAVEPHPDAAVVADGSFFQQILTELLENAARFTDRGGVRVAVSPRDGGWVLAVHDTGLGIAPAALGALFKPFELVASASLRSRQGPGLGLYLARRLAERMDGTLQVQSTPGAGSTFELWLPAAAART